MVYFELFEQCRCISKIKTNIRQHYNWSICTPTNNLHQNNEHIANWITSVNLIKVNDLQTCRNIAAWLINYPICSEPVQRVTVRLMLLYDLFIPPVLRACLCSCAWPTASARRLREITGTGVPDHFRTYHRLINAISPLLPGHLEFIRNLKLNACSVRFYLVELRIVLF